MIIDNSRPDSNVQATGEVMPAGGANREPVNGRREALLKLGKLAAYAAPVTVALMSDKAMANYF